MIFTTNKPLSEWGKVLHDEDLAAAILDRILERGRFIRLDGPSGRTRHLKLEDALLSGTENARISGIRVPEFLEPTTVGRQAEGKREERRTEMSKPRSFDEALAEGFYIDADYSGKGGCDHFFGNNRSKRTGHVVMKN